MITLTDVLPVHVWPQVAHNLEINQHRLTTPFDINALLDDVLRFDGQPNQNIPTDRRSISLFDKVSDLVYGLLKMRLVLFERPFGEKK